MAREVECKIHIPEYRLTALTDVIDKAFPAIVKQVVDKRDVYYSRDGLTADFRIRQENSILVLTRKQKEHRNDRVEVNDEIEFTVPRKESVALHAFFESLGYVPLIEKGKQGNLWKDGGLSIELVHVVGLGYYLEMERLLEDSATDEQVQSALEELSDLRTRLGVAGYPLEGRYYLEMLQEQNS